MKLSAKISTETIEVPGRKIDNGKNKTEKRKRALTNERFFEVVWLPVGNITTPLIRTFGIHI